MTPPESHLTSTSSSSDVSKKRKHHLNYCVTPLRLRHNTYFRVTHEIRDVMSKLPQITVEMLATDKLHSLQFTTAISSFSAVYKHSLRKTTTHIFFSICQNYISTISSYFGRITRFL